MKLYDKMANKEVKIALYDKLKIIPSDNIEFLRYLLIDKGYSNNTIESYKKYLKFFLEFF